MCVCRLETVYEIAGDFRPTTSGSTKRGKIKLWTEDGMCVLYVHTLMYIHTYIHKYMFLYLHIYNVLSMWISQCISHAQKALNVATITRARRSTCLDHKYCIIAMVYAQDIGFTCLILHFDHNPAYICVLRIPSSVFPHCSCVVCLCVQRPRSFTGPSVRWGQTLL